MAENKHAIAVNGLTKTYANKVRALDGLTLAVEAGSIFALLGPNGAGKSTTVKILTTLSRPNSGEARVAGMDVVREAQGVRRAIGCVAQKSGVDVESTGRENLTLQGQFHGLRGADLKRRVAELLDRFSLINAADRIAKTYSGGMQRKLDIAMALIHRPKVLFLDEPTTGLDPESRAELWDEIARVTAEGLTVLLTTHYLEEADRLAQRVAIVDRGRVVTEGSPEGLKAELRGDSIQVELSAAASLEQVGEALRGVPAVRDLQISGTLLHARADQGATAVPGMLLALESQGMRVASVKVSRPTLDDVYLQYTGRTIEQAEQAGVKQAVQQ
ncbi:MAG: ATP-binding cassette domain-containing protein [Acidobacteriota bacterium]|nr:ATP-binding cassette domain-containing protein [Acidobacteriota bacterium]